MYTPSEEEGFAVLIAIQFFGGERTLTGDVVVEEQPFTVTVKETLYVPALAQVTDGFCDVLVDGDPLVKAQLYVPPETVGVNTDAIVL